MNTLYHWVGFAVVWGGLITAASYLGYFLAAVVAGLWSIFTRSRHGNRWFLFKDWLLYLQTGRYKSQEPGLGNTSDLLQSWNNRYGLAARLRKEGPYRRDFLAWIIRRQRAAGLLQRPARATY